MFGNVNWTPQSFSMMQLALEDDSGDLLESEMYGDDDSRLAVLTSNEVKQLAKMAQSLLVNERESAGREVCKVLRYVDTLSCPKLADEVFQVIDLLARDQASCVQCALLEGMSSMLSLCAKSAVLSPFIPSILTPLLVRTLTSSSTDNVRKNAIGIVGLLLEQTLIPQECLLSSIIPTLFSLCSVDLSHDAHTYIADEQRVESASVLCRTIATGLVKDRAWILSDFVPKYSYLLADSIFHIRKAAVSILGDLCKMYGEKFAVEFAIPHIILVSKDDMWGVRKAVCEVFVDIAIFCPHPLRRSTLAPIFVSLLRDTSRWVSYIAFQELGPFISTFADSSITGLMLKDGQVCRHEPESIEKEKKEDEVVSVCKEIPSGCYIPPLPDNINGRVKDELDEADALEQLLGDMNDEKEKSGVQRCRSEEQLIGGHGVSSKCHSLDDLSKIGLDNDIKMMDKDDEDEMDIVTEREASCGSPPPSSSTHSSSDDSFYSNVYWSSYTIDDEMELTPFGSSSVDSPKRKKREEYMDKRMDVLIDNRQLNEKDEIDDGKMEIDNDNDKSNNHDEIVPFELVEHFVKMVTGPSNDADMNRQCAHNFPAVAFTLGKESWNDLRDTYTTLSKDHQWRVRVSLANSMHEMAVIVGSETTEKDLLPVFDALREDVDEVRGGLLKHLSDFYKGLPIPSRQAMLTKLPHFLRVDREGETNWRFRLEFARQCSRLCDLYDVDSINGTIAGIALTLATDRVSDVRIEAARLLAKILHLMVNEEWNDKENTTESDESIEDMPLTTSFVHDIVRGFAYSQRWSRRQTFLHMVEFSRSLLTETQLGTLLLREVLHLSCDPVANVRIVVARALNPPLKESCGWRERVLSVLDKLSNDNDMDVSRQARLSLGAHPNKEVIDISRRAIRIAEKESNLLDDDRRDNRMDNLSFSSDMSISPNSSTLS